MSKVQLQIMAAFEEGFLAGADHGNLSYKYPPHNIAWLESTTRKENAFAELTPVQRATIRAWHDAKIDDQVDAPNEQMP